MAKTPYLNNEDENTVVDFKNSGYSLRDYSKISGIPKSTLWDMVQRANQHTSLNTAASTATTKTKKLNVDKLYAKVDALHEQLHDLYDLLDKYNN